MPEGLSPAEVGKEISHHKKHGDRHEREHHPHERWLTIAEAVLLSIVAVLAAWSGYSAAKWSTESRVELAKASSLRSEANRAEGEAAALRNFDSSTFDAWFTAYVAKNEQAMRIAEHRFRPAFRVAFDAWRATNPETNPNAPRGPTYMPQYKEPGVQKARELDRQAEEAFARGQSTGSDADKYVRLTVILASVLFLVGISGHFAVRAARYGLITLACILLVFSLVQLALLPLPPR